MYGNEATIKQKVYTNN